MHIFHTIRPARVGVPGGHLSDSRNSAAAVSDDGFSPRTRQRTCYTQYMYSTCVHVKRRYRSPGESFIIIHSLYLVRCVSISLYLFRPLTKNATFVFRHFYHTSDCYTHTTLRVYTPVVRALRPAICLRSTRVCSSYTGGSPYEIQIL